MTRFPDPVEAGLARGWKVVDGSREPLPDRMEADVVIVGTGAGGGVTAEILARAGLDVLMIEEGPLRSSRDFDMRESRAYPDLYQESAARRTADGAIAILQGRCVGGSTTVNWTTSFRTPPATLAFWRERYGLAGLSPEALAPWFEQVERRLSIAPWPMAPNANNALLARGAARLGIPTATISRNVRGCINLGYCGVGCPVNAKQSMLVTTIPVALDAGARLVTRTRALRLLRHGRVAAGLEIAPLDAAGLAPGSRTVTVAARHYVLAGGAINTPGLLLRSEAPDPERLAGKRTFLHPTVLSIADMAEPVRGFEGAPQSMYSDHFLGRDPIDGPIGFKLEVPPLHPVLFASTLPGFGEAHAQAMRRFAHSHVLIALLRDGFSERSPGGRVTLRGDGTPLLDYPLDDFVLEGARRAFDAMARIQFAAGATSVGPGHERAGRYATPAAALAAIAALPMRPRQVKMMSAHVMGGCAMAADPARGLVGPDGVHRHLDNVSVHDGSLFPTSVGANPQLSIYALCAMLAAGLATRLTGRRDAKLAA